MKNQLYNLSYLRTIACASVVLLHVSASETVIYRDVLSPSQILVGTFIYNIMMWAVPCFIMVSGAFLLDKSKNITIAKVLTVYVRRVLLALIVFSIIFRLFDAIMNKETFSFAIITDIMSNIYRGTGWSHIWYLYMIMGLYLILPLIKQFSDNCTDNEYKYMLLLCIIMLSLLQVSKIFGFSSGFYIHIATIYPFYLMLGHAIHSDVIRLSMPVNCILILTGVLGITVFTKLGNDSILENASVFTGYSSIFVIMLATGIFALFDKIHIDNKSYVTKIVADIDANSFGIYLIHMIFVRYVLRYKEINLFATQNAFIVYSIMFIATFTLSYLVIKLLKTLPFIKTLKII